MADNLRSNDPSPEKVLGDKAVGGVDADKDHVPNVVSGLKATLNNDNVSEAAKHEAEVKLHGLSKLNEADQGHEGHGHA
ncbi:hypothetical protein GJ744_007894 [Endocarpon pusillum]|uniref:Conidiation-specific protein 6 n=1 Tax=Endocarpon pusillum TaxID=364733 RepID=A0A8H7ALC4_9EURO|nr:hypothetical protein GJ744_007894 [Endocarpon pusillum]